MSQSQNSERTRILLECLVIFVSLALLTLYNWNPTSNFQLEIISLWILCTSTSFLWGLKASESFLSGINNLQTFRDEKQDQRISQGGNLSFRHDADPGLLGGIFMIPFSILVRLPILQETGHTTAAGTLRELFWCSLLCEGTLLLSILLSPLLPSFFDTNKKEDKSSTQDPFSPPSYFISLLLFSFVSGLFVPEVLREHLPPTFTFLILGIGFYGILRILLRFERAFTFGEGVVLSQLIVLFALDSFRDASRRLLGIPSDDKQQQQGEGELVESSKTERTQVDVVIYSLLLGVLLLGMILWPLIYRSRKHHRHAHSTATSLPIRTHKPHDSKEEDGNVSREVKASTIPKSPSMTKAAIWFYILLFVLLLLVLAPILQALLNQHPLIWVFFFLCTEGRILLAGYWVGLLGVSLYVVARPSQMRSTTPNIIIRKYFHALALLLFVPGIMFERHFLRLSFAVAIFCFLLVEYIRLGCVPPIGKSIDTFMRTFTDKRDSGDLILTHTYLLLGCALPLWINGGEFCFHSLAPYSGLLVLGIGDSMASIVGKRFGKNRWPGTKKTLEGTSAAILSVFLCAILIHVFLNPLEVRDQGKDPLLPRKIPGTPGPGSQVVEQQGEEVVMMTMGLNQWIGVGIATVLASLLESFTTQIDNLFLPLFYEALLVLLLS